MQFKYLRNNKIVKPTLLKDLSPGDKFKCADYNYLLTEEYSKRNMSPTTRTAIREGTGVRYLFSYKAQVKKI